MLKVLLVGQKVEDWRCLNLTCVAADTRGECHQVSRVEIRWQGKWKMVWVLGVCTHTRLSCCKRWRAPTSQMSLCQRQPGIPEEVFQWWCYPRRISTGRMREWVSAELAILYSQTDASLWVSYILRIRSNHRVAHRLWSQRYLYLIYFSCATLYARYELYDQTLKWYLLHGKPRGIITGPPGLLDTQGSPGAFIWGAL